MSKHYTDETLAAAVWALVEELPMNCTGGCAKDPVATQASRAVLDAVAARFKAEALRDFAHSLAIARVISDHDPSQSQTSETLTAVIEDMFARADAFDAEAKS